MGMWFQVDRSNAMLHTSDMNSLMLNIIVMNVVVIVFTARVSSSGCLRFKDPHRSYLSVTHQGGTPNYMAPELFNGSRVDEKADVYSMGCILYECVARRTPFSHLAAGFNKSFNILFKVGLLFVCCGCSVQCYCVGLVSKVMGPVKLLSKQYV